MFKALRKYLPASKRDREFMADIVRGMNLALDILAETRVHIDDAAVVEMLEAAAQAEELERHVAFLREVDKYCPEGGHLLADETIPAGIAAGIATMAAVVAEALKEQGPERVLAALSRAKTAPPISRATELLRQLQWMRA